MQTPPPSRGSDRTARVWSPGATRAESEGMRTTDEEITGVLDTVLEIAFRRRETLCRLRNAVNEGDVTAVFEIAKQLCGADDEQIGNRID